MKSSSLFPSQSLSRSSLFSKSLWVSCGLAAITLLSTVDTAQAYRLTNRDLRYFGYSGSYRGFVEGNVQTWNGYGYDNRYVDERSREILPTRSRDVVTAPTGTNGFFLNYSRATGNSRRMKIRAYYSGISYNSAFGEDMVGSGSKTITVERRGYYGDRYEMQVIDNLDEHSAYDGALFSSWRIRGALSKGY